MPVWPGVVSAISWVLAGTYAYFTRPAGPDEENWHYYEGQREAWWNGPKGDIHLPTMQDPG